MGSLCIRVRLASRKRQSTKRVAHSETVCIGGNQTPFTMSSHYLGYSYLGEFIRTRSQAENPVPGFRRPRHRHLQRTKI